MPMVNGVNRKTKLRDSEDHSLGAILGVDYGLRRVGLSICFDKQRLAVGAGWLEGLSGRTLARAVKAAAVERNAGLIVIGQPPEDARDADRVTAGADALTASLKRMGLKVVRWNEDYTTAAVLKERRKYGGKSSKPKGWVDEAAAIFILQDYIDNRQTLKTLGHET